ncbi:MAG: hypothetical protein ACLT5P_06630 [Flavonifractor plautii]
MKKTHWPARLAAGCLVPLTLVGVAFAAGQQSQSDPLVTRAICKATPSILSQVDKKPTARETELKKQLSAVVEGYVKEVEDKLASSGGGSNSPRRRILSGSQPLRRANHHRRRGVNSPAQRHATCVSDTSRPGGHDRRNDAGRRRP